MEQVIGKHSKTSADNAIKRRIAGTLGVASLDAYSSSVTPDRAYKGRATVTTIYSASQKPGSIINLPARLDYNFILNQSRMA
jgi:hypothetical protein